MCLLGTVEATAQSLPTFSQLESVAYGESSALSKCGMKKLRFLLHEYDGEEVGSKYYGKNARVDAEGRVTPTADHAIVVELYQGSERTNLTIYFSNTNDYQTFLSRNKTFGNWALESKSKHGKMYVLDFAESGD